MRPIRLKRRADFLAAAKGRRVKGRDFTVQIRQRADELGPRVGFTVTKKVGNAPERNRIKRRLRAVCAANCGAFAAGTDYVILARRGVLSAPFQSLEAALWEATAGGRHNGLG
ncbi:MAG: ribonuclease P protein component [Pseudomonadota bacterium]